MSSTRAAGQRAERRAAVWLEARGLRLVETNFTCKGGEIDLVCEDGDVLVFVEVRSRASTEWGTPEETVGGLKRHRLIHAARVYLSLRDCEERHCRFDVVSITGDDLEHIPDAFEVEGY